MPRRFGPGRNSTFNIVRRTVKRARRWRGDQNSRALGALAIDVRNIVNVADYEQSTTLEPSGSTLVSIRGGLRITSDIAVMAGCWALHVRDQQEANITTLDSGALTDEDILAAGVWASTPETPFLMEFNVRTMRRLRNDAVTLIVDNNISATGVIENCTRCLLVGG